MNMEIVHVHYHTNLNMGPGLFIPVFMIYSILVLQVSSVNQNVECILVYYSFRGNCKKKDEQNETNKNHMPNTTPTSPQSYI